MPTAFLNWGGVGLDGFDAVDMRISRRGGKLFRAALALCWTIWCVFGWRAPMGKSKPANNQLISGHFSAELD